MPGSLQRDGSREAWRQRLEEPRSVFDEFGVPVADDYQHRHLQLAQPLDGVDVRHELGGGVRDTLGRQPIEVLGEELLRALGEAS